MKTRKKVLLCCAVLLCTSALVVSLAAQGPSPGVGKLVAVRHAQVQPSEPVKPDQTGPSNTTSVVPASRNAGVAGLPPGKMREASPATSEIKATSVTAGPTAAAPAGGLKPADMVGNVPGSGAPVYTGNVITPSKGRGVGVLYAPTEPDNATFRAAVSALLGGLPCDYFDARTGTPTLAQLQNYGLVMTWVNYAYADKVGMGNVLADYVDVGGKVILGQWCYHSTQGNWLEGRIMTTAYCPVTVDSVSFTTSSYNHDGATCIYIAPNPVANFDASYRDHINSVLPIGLSDGHYQDGYIVSGYRTDMAVVYCSGHTGDDYSTGDWPMVTANIYLCGGTPLIGACCNTATGVCVDGTSPSDCLAGGQFMRWFYQEQCSELEPLCADIVGACCLETNCEMLTPYQCYLAGGEYNGDGTSCDPNPCLCADFFVTAPGSWTGTTCGAGNDCALRGTEEVIYAVTIPWAGNWIFDLCGSSFDTYMFVGTSCCGAELGFDDDSSQCGLQSYMMFSGLAAGTYYMDIEGYSGCGNYVFNVHEPMGACCLHGACIGDMSQPACTAQGGSWYGGQTCASFTCPGGCQESEIDITYVPDYWPYETSWQLVQEGTGATICVNPPMTTAFATYLTICCVTNDGCYDWNCQDAYGDGTYAPGGYEIRFNGVVVASTLGSGWYGSSTSVTQIGGCVFTGACCFAGPPYCVVVTQPECDLAGGFWLGAWTTCGPIVDCDGDGIIDSCAIGSGISQDCNENGIPDNCDIASGYSTDCQPDGIPDECQDDCNGNGIADTCDIANCDGSYWCLDCQPDGIPDGCQLGQKGRPAVGMLYAPTEPDNAAFRAAVSAIIGAPVDYFDARSGTPTVAQMQAYAAVLTWVDYAYLDQVTMGNNLADYADAGGIVILGQWCLPTAGNYLAGRIMTDPGYNPATGTYYDGSQYAGDGTECMYAGVTAFEALSYRDHISVVPGATSNGTFLDGVPAVAYWPGFVPAIYYNPGNTGDSYSTGDWAILVANIIINCGGPQGHDCNGNLIPDDCDIMYCPPGVLWCADCNGNGYPDICDPDCDGDGIPDECVIANCPPGDPSCADCDGNKIPDACDIAHCDPEDNFCQDCNGNGVPDGCDIASGLSNDCNDNGVPDECESLADCNGDGIPDICDPDCNGNGISDVCDILFCDGSYWCLDCQPDGIPDGCQLGAGLRGVVYDGTPGTGAPPADLGPYTMTPFPPDPRPNNQVVADIPVPAASGLTGAIGIVPNPTKTVIGQGWASWSHGYTGDVYYYYSDPGPVTFTMPEKTGAVYFYIEPNMFTPAYNVTCVANLGLPSETSSGPVPVLGQGGAAYFGFYGTGTTQIVTVTVTVDPGASGWASGEFGIAKANLGADCNGNLIPDFCDIRDCATWPPEDQWKCSDCNENGIPDACEPDCNNDRVPDDCDIAYGTSLDCNGNGVPDECDLASGTSQDCNANGIPDECDIATGYSHDCNKNGIPDECDIASGTSQDCQLDGIPDECQLRAKDSRYVYMYDDGSDENSLGWTAGGELCWLHHFTVQTGAEQIDTVMTCYGSALYPGSPGVTAGQAVRVFFWADSTGTGDPHNAVFVAEYPGMVSGLSIDTDVLQSIPIDPPICVGPDAPGFGNNSFFIGASVVHTSGGYPAPMDTNSSSLGRAWICGVPSGVFDPHSMTNLYNMDSIGYPCVWLLRANGDLCGPPANDCNRNGIPDECDIQDTFPGGFCHGTTYPPCDTDYNGDGIPDHCQVCGDFTSTPTPPYGAPDGLVNDADYWYIHDGIGFSVGHPKYAEHILADMDHDGTISLQDYQSWLMCYRMATGKVFVPPTKKPAPAPQPKPVGGKLPTGGSALPAASMKLAR